MNGIVLDMHNHVGTIIPLNKILSVLISPGIIGLSHLNDWRKKIDGKEYLVSLDYENALNIPSYLEKFKEKGLRKKYVDLMSETQLNASLPVEISLTLNKIKDKNLLFNNYFMNEEGVKEKLRPKNLDSEIKTEFFFEEIIPKLLSRITMNVRVNDEVHETQGYFLRAQEIITTTYHLTSIGVKEYFLDYEPKTREYKGLKEVLENLSSNNMIGINHPFILQGRKGCYKICFNKRGLEELLLNNKKISMIEVHNGQIPCILNFLNTRVEEFAKKFSNKYYNLIPYSSSDTHIYSKIIKKNGIILKKDFINNLNEKNFFEQIKNNYLGLKKKNFF